MTPRGKPRSRTRRYERAPRVAAHVFVADPAIPADHKGRGTCATCKSPGEPGDARHPLETPTRVPVVPDAVRAQHAARDAAILGEAGDD